MKDTETLDMFAPAALAVATGTCPECGKPTIPIFGAAQRALLPGAPELHARCLDKRLDRERAAEVRS